MRWRQQSLCSAGEINRPSEFIPSIYSTWWGQVRALQGLYHVRCWQIKFLHRDSQTRDLANVPDEILLQRKKPWCQRRSSELFTFQRSAASISFLTTSLQNSLRTTKNQLLVMCDLPPDWFHVHLEPTWFIRSLPLLGWQRATLLGQRIGEADHPGPANRAGNTPLTLRITTLNPTSLHDKEHILSEINHEVFILAENSTTVSVQKLADSRLRGYGYNSVWGKPVPHKRHDVCADEGRTGLRGASAGVSVHSCFPLRSSDDSPSEWWDASRLMRAFLQIGEWEIQLIAVYGLTMSHPGARTRTNHLLQEAASWALQCDMPTIIAGDLNHPVSSMDAWNPLQRHGWQHAGELHHELYGRPLPPTYQQATTPDFLMISPHLSPFVRGVSVDHHGCVPGHHPLTIELELAAIPPLKTAWRLPRSWIPFEPEPHRIEHNYSLHRLPPGVLASAGEDPSEAFSTWSQKVEKSVHFAIKQAHEHRPEWQPFTGLPRACQGRGRQPPLIKRSPQHTVKRAWAGHYTPTLNVATLQLRQHVRQLRRIQSLKFRVKKLQTFEQIWHTTICQLQQEWNAILKAPGFFVNFSRWLDHHPELMGPWDDTPTAEVLYDIEQLLQYEVHQRVQHEKRQQAQQKTFHRWYDKAKGHLKSAFRSLREQGPGILCKAQAKISCTARVYDNVNNGLVEITMKQLLPLRPEATWTRFRPLLLPMTTQP